MDFVAILSRLSRYEGKDLYVAFVWPYAFVRSLMYMYMYTRICTVLNKKL